MGLADPNTLVLDPATGTATFLYYAIRHIYETLQEQGQGGAWSAYVRENLLPRIFGFELLMAPYTVAHMKLGILLGELGYDFGGDERLRVYLTNTLEEGFHPDETIGFAEYIAEEADAAATVKKDEPIEVIIGNPPYSEDSANKGAWITDLIDDYKKVDGEPLGERNPKALLNDYVKFVRFGQWRVEKTKQGVLAFITSHTYLDSVVCRGMRQSLINSFSDIYILDLHGDIRAREITPEGDKDGNVFDQIQTGVSICIAIKEPGKTGPAHVYHYDLWGARKGKDAWLAEESVETTEWRAISPQPPSYYLVPRERELALEYEQVPSITEIFGSSTLGFKTHRDQFAVAFDRATIAKRISDLRDSTTTNQEIENRYKISSTRDWNLSQARSRVHADNGWKQKFTPCLFRPFDQRYCYLSEVAMDWPRPDLMAHGLKDNLMLVAGRQGQAVGPDEWQVISATQYPADTNLFRRGGNQIFPLYLYPQNDNLFDAAEEGRRPNLSPEFVAELSERLGLAFVPDGRGDMEETFGPEDVFYYAYAVFHSPEYRERYAEFLKRDFPRLPLTSDRELFAALAEKGAELTGLHFMTSPALAAFVTRFPEGGTNEVEKVRYAASDGRVYINNEQYFEGVREEVWEFRVGGYQVLDKWLKDRKGRTLSYDDIRHYQKIVVALSETRRLMAEIDGIIPGWPIE